MSYRLPCQLHPQGQTFPRKNTRISLEYLLTPFGLFCAPESLSDPDGRKSSKNWSTLRSRYLWRHLAPPKSFSISTSTIKNHSLSLFPLSFRVNVLIIDFIGQQPLLLSLIQRYIDSDPPRNRQTLVARLKRTYLSLFGRLEPFWKVEFWEERKRRASGCCFAFHFAKIGKKTEKQEREPSSLVV